jgi:hypothetical protein
MKVRNRFDDYGDGYRERRDGHDGCLCIHFCFSLLFIALKPIRHFCATQNKMRRYQRGLCAQWQRERHPGTCEWYISCFWTGFKSGGPVSKMPKSLARISETNEAVSIMVVGEGKRRSKNFARVDNN